MALCYVNAIIFTYMSKSGISEILHLKKPTKNFKNDEPPLASSSIFNMERGPKVVRIISATAYKKIQKIEIKSYRKQNQKNLNVAITTPFPPIPAYTNTYVVTFQKNINR